MRILSPRFSRSAHGFRACNRRHTAAPRLVRICLADPSFAFVAGIVERLPIRKLALLQQPLTSEMMSVSSRNQNVARDATLTFSMKVQSSSNRLDIAERSDAEFCYSRVPLRFESETRKLVESGPNTSRIGQSSRFDTARFAPP